MRSFCVGICCIALSVHLSACKTTAMASGNKAAMPASSTNNAQDTAAGKKTASIATTERGNIKDPSIISILLKAHHTASQPLAFGITQLSVKEGFLKRNTTLRDPRYLKACFTDANGNKVDSSYFENPLQRRVEYPGDDNKLNTAYRTTDEGDAYIRVNYKAAITTLIIFDNDNNAISTFDLNTYLK